jgi:hypothetical protein
MMISSQPCQVSNHPKRKRKVHPATTNPTNTPTPGLTPLIPSPPSPPNNKEVFFKFELVLPNCSLSTPECPFEVANTEGGTLAVLRVLVYALVENVFVA